MNWQEKLIVPGGIRQVNVTAWQYHPLPAPKVQVKVTACLDLAYGVYEQSGAKVTPQHGTPVGGAQLGDCLVFDLPNSFPCEVKPFADIFQAHGMIYPDAKEKAYHVFLSFSKSSQ